jgi:hypothetical protein
MSDRFDALALPSRDPYMAVPHGPGYGMPPQVEPPLLWRLTRRHWKVLLACAAVSLGAAYLAGKFLAKPLWQAEATLLYQPIAFPDVKQKAAYEHPPSLPTLASWVKEPILLRQIIDEFHLGVSEDALADTFLKVEQPASTESIVVDFKWPDPVVAPRVLARLLDLYVDYVVTTRKEAVLLRIEKMDQQAAYACEDDIKRCNGQIVALEQKLAQTGKLSDEDLDGSMLARQGALMQSVRNGGQKVAELKSDLRSKRADRDTLAPVVQQQAESRIKLKALDDLIEQLELQIAHLQESIEADNLELRTLPIVLTKAKRNERMGTLTYLKEQLKQHESARAYLGKPGGPPARGALVGMDANEFMVKSPPRVGDKPASSSKKTLFAVTFLGLMAAAFGLLFVYDRRHPAPDGPLGGARTVYVTPPPAGSTLNGADVHRLSARIQQWVRETHAPIVTPPPEPPTTIGPDGKVEDKGSPPATNGHAGDADTDLLAQRMQQWLGDGHGPG